MNLSRFASAATRLLFAIAAILAWSVCGWAGAQQKAIDFTRDIRPILAENCFHCHGTDPDARQAELRLDVWQKDGEIHGAEEVIVPGKATEGELIARITSTDDDQKMPPPDSGKKDRSDPERPDFLQAHAHTHNNTV